MSCTRSAPVAVSRVALLVLAGCFGPDSDGAPDADAGPPDGGEPGDWKTVHACRSSDPRDPIDVMDAFVEGDSLIVRFGHGGGCAEHEYGLCFADEWLEEVPVQVRLTLLHDAHGDGCQAYLTSEDTFDLRPIAEEYEARYQTDSGTVNLLLGSGGVEYSFGPDAASGQ